MRQTLLSSVKLDSLDKPITEKLLFCDDSDIFTMQLNNLAKRSPSLLGGAKPEDMVRCRSHGTSWKLWYITVTPYMVGSFILAQVRGVAIIGLGCGICFYSLLAVSRPTVVVIVPLGITWLGCS